MQKKIIALAIAGLASSAAFAQTNVTIYGVADAFVSWSNQNGGNSANARPEAHGRDTLNVGSGGLAGSRLGFRGTEDLGNGVKAVFVLEYGLNLTGNQGIGAGNPAHANMGPNTLATDTGANAMARQQYVGLQTGLGTLSFGRQYAPGYYSSANDAQVWSVLSAKRNMQEFLNGTVNGNSNARWDNSINYLSPTMGGFSVQAIYQGGAQANEIAQRESFGIGLKYAAGPVVVEYGYHNSNGLPNTATTGSAAALAAGFPSGVKTEEHYINTSFDAKVVKVFAAGQTIDQGNRMAAGVGNKGWGATAGVVVPAGKANIHLAYAYGDLNANTRSLNPSGTTVFQGQRDSLSAVVTYGMSKRTTLYGGAIYSDTDVRNAGGVVTTVAAGINHAF